MPHVCEANNQTTAAVELLHEFQRHYHQFNSVIQQVCNEEGTDVFHLRFLLEDLNQYSNLLSQHAQIFDDQNEWQTLHFNIQHMILDVQTIHNHPAIDPDFLRWAYTHRTTSGIADFLGVSHRTVRRALLDNGIASPGNAPPHTRSVATVTPDENEESRDQLLDPRLSVPNIFPPEVETAASLIQSSSSSVRRSNMSNDDLDSLIRLLRSHYARAGIQMLHGMLRRLGHIVPYERIRHSLIRVDPVHRVFERISIRRRQYSVPGPNSLWHHDGHHLHNVRIERLWVDVSNYISQHWHDLFTQLEEQHQLNINNPNHIWLLHHLFMDTINNSLAFWVEGWNCHRISQRRGDGPARSPEDMWGFDMIVHGIRGDSLDQYSMTDAELEVFGVDWEGLGDETLLQSLRRNYAHEQGSNTWLGQLGPPQQLNEVRLREDWLGRESILGTMAFVQHENFSYEWV
ncbi:hypothetical protein EV360DRAFT_92379 [Lentinula raphanica]|nr:hypothetical protein EV360DRAFT_92379 [Lentinula raphanica]